MYDSVRVIYNGDEFNQLYWELRNTDPYATNFSQRYPDVLIPQPSLYPVLVKYRWVSYAALGGGVSDKDHWEGFYVTLGELSYFLREVQKRQEYESRDKSTELLGVIKLLYDAGVL